MLNNSALVKTLNKDAESKRYNESFGYWEDDSKENGTWRGGSVGDTRAAITPFMAHKHFGDTYKWMLYGDDDTLFFMTGVLRLLSSLDPNVPMAISDNLWASFSHPSADAPRCLPCSFNLSSVRSNDSFIPRPGCPFCTRALACGTYSPAYRCSQEDRGRMRAAYGPKLTDAVHDHVNSAHAGSSSQGGSAGADTAGSSTQEHGPEEGWAAAMRRTADNYSSWMHKHVSLHDRYRHRFSGHHSADWEMRDGPGGEQHKHQQYMNSTAQLSHVLGKRDGRNAEKWDELKLSHDFCAVHDDRLHARPVKYCHQATAHGGAGLIMSVGLMRMINPDDAIAHILRQKGCGGCDCLITNALWFRFGIGITDPGAPLQWGNGYRRYTLFADSKRQAGELVALADTGTPLLQPLHPPVCDDACAWLNERVVSTHVRARKSTVSGVVERMEGLLRAHTVAYDRVLEARKDPAVAAGLRTVQSYIIEKYGKVKLLQQNDTQAAGALERTS